MKKSLGPSFPDEMAKVTGKSRHFFKKRKEENWSEALLPNFHFEPQQTLTKSIWIVTFFIGLCLILFFTIFLRLFYLQIISGKENRELADGNRIQIKIIHAPRGVIFDRNGRILAANSPAFRLFDNDTHRARLVTREEALEWEVKNDPRVVNLEVDNVRTYPQGEELAHILGYVGEISGDQLKDRGFGDYRAGDRIGRLGIEAEYEKVLHGVDGGEIIEVDSKGAKLRTLRSNPPIPGQNIYLTIDASLQDKLYQLTRQTLDWVGSCCAAVIAQDPKSGQILALLSFPTFDPNLFTQNGDEGVISEILSRADAPILNRVVAGTYPPGSTFKIVSSLAALGSGKITADTTIYDNGIIYLGPYKFTNWYFNQYGRTEGPVNLVKAIQRSNDTYFYEIGRIIGENALADWSRKLYFGRKLGIDLPGEESGLVPDNGWKQKNLGLPWYPGDTLHLVIGQGFALTTPLQILAVTSFIAADGVLYKPQLVFGEKPKILVSSLLPRGELSLIKKGLELVPKEGGTAWPFFTFPIASAGKTGTAEYGDPKGRTHAWYTSYAPANDPKIAMTVLIEGGGEGSSVAAPIAKEAYRWFFSPDKNHLIRDVNRQATDSGRTLGE